MKIGDIWENSNGHAIIVLGEFEKHVAGLEMRDTDIFGLCEPITIGGEQYYYDASKPTFSYSNKLTNYRGHAPEYVVEEILDRVSEALGIKSYKPAPQASNTEELEELRNKCAKLETKIEVYKELLTENIGK